MSARLASGSGRGATIVPATTARTISTPAGGKVTSGGSVGATSAPRRLATPIEVERSWTPDRDAMAAALLVALGLPRLLSHPAGGGKR